MSQVCFQDAFTPVERRWAIESSRVMTVLMGPDEERR